MNRFGLAVSTFAVLFAGCAGDRVLTAQQYFDAGNDAMKGETYDLAVEQYQKLLEEYPFSEYTEEAQLKIAHAQYLEERYTESIASFQDFQRMHPTNPNLAFAEFHVAHAYMDQIGKKARDLKAAENAHAHFQSVIDRHPDSPYAEEAKKKLRECREILGGHELFVAEFYLLWENPVGAEARLKHLLETYPDTEVSAEALMTFGGHFEERGDLARAAMVYATLVERNPASPRLGDAKAELEDLARRKVTAPENPLVALMETLGRPAKPGSASEDETAASEEAPASEEAARLVDSPETIR